MTNFIIHFLLSNLFLCGMIGILSAAKGMFRSVLSARMCYNLDILLFCLLAVPFLPVRLNGLSQVFSLLQNQNANTLSQADAAGGAIPATDQMLGQIHDLAVSVSAQTPSVLGSVFCVIWIAGMLVVLLFFAISALHLHRIKRSALPLEHPDILHINDGCLRELNIKKQIPIYSTTRLASPSLTGVFAPRILLPLHLISDHQPSELRYILLHELQHEKYKDPLTGCLIHLATALYWFNPLIWYMKKRMRDDREIACDASVLRLLGEDDCLAYGNALLNYAQKLSFSSPLAPGIAGNAKQIKRRIAHIAAYQRPTVSGRRKGIAACALICVLFLALAPILSTYAANDSHYDWDTSKETISALDASTYLDGYEGSFVLYDQKKDSWSIYDMDRALFRSAPNSTYKIYDALFHLDAGDITPDHSMLSWDHQEYPYEAWNRDQTLTSAMQFSVNWYFQTLDAGLGREALQSYLHRIEYGNERMSADLSSYWMESELKISPVEQVLLLRALYENEWGFAPEAVDAVKDGLRLSVSGSVTLYGKTGTGRVDGKNQNGWFVGCVETKDNAFFFALNLSAKDQADGTHASEIAVDLLTDLNIL